MTFASEPAAGWVANVKSTPLGTPVLRDSRDIVARLKREGFEEVSARGSHHKFVHRGLRRIVIVPHPRRDIPQGTVQSIYRQAGWQKD